ncbi:hypothetical protein P691DRAFT_764509 [Macrolepiota fuliginosa MF-IS2]|uniref:Uncharacterized protein n=1 Tax=Macrolepiota fuliginosa MF-IS2 TaxID=1400762 RepID=A0A9P5X1Q1_9AGAR|nr:hypothetical protein P691DRAFT_764509 [Macrolepiota fuliginosa MF-IS2]
MIALTFGHKKATNKPIARLPPFAPDHTTIDSQQQQPTHTQSHIVPDKSNHQAHLGGSIQGLERGGTMDTTSNPTSHLREEHRMPAQQVLKAGAAGIYHQPLNFPLAPYLNTVQPPHQLLQGYVYPSYFPPPPQLYGYPQMYGYYPQTVLPPPHPRQRTTSIISKNAQSRVEQPRSSSDLGKGKGRMTEERPPHVAPERAKRKQREIDIDLSENAYVQQIMNKIQEAGVPKELWVQLSTSLRHDGCYGIMEDLIIKNRSLEERAEMLEARILLLQTQTTKLQQRPREERLGIENDRPTKRQTLPSVASDEAKGVPDTPRNTQSTHHHCQNPTTMDTPIHHNISLAKGLLEPGPTVYNPTLNTDTPMDEANASDHQRENAPSDQMDITSTETNVFVMQTASPNPQPPPKGTPTRPSPTPPLGAT